ncbi:MAG: hypothetical protein WCH98_07605, partial [Verrucomicrobiota bacterium]
PPNKKRAIRCMIENIGGGIVLCIRIWRILLHRRRGKALFRIIRKKIHRKLRPLIERIEPRWRVFRKVVLRPMDVRLHLLWRRILWFHRRTPVPRLRRLYLGGFATFFLLAFVTLWIVSSRNRIAQDPQTALAILMQDTANHIAEKRLNRAEKNLAELKRLAPRHPTVLIFSGAIKSLRKDYDGARADYLLALKASPNSFNAAFNLAEVDFVTKSYPAAATKFHGMLTSRPDDEVLLFRLFLCELLQNHEGQAKFYLDRISISGQTPAWYYANAARLFRINKKSEARALLNTAKILYPEKTAFFDASNELLGYR